MQNLTTALCLHSFYLPANDIKPDVWEGKFNKPPSPEYCGTSSHVVERSLLK